LINRAALRLGSAAKNGSGRGARVTNSVKLADNAIATYNLAHEMSLSPQSLYQPFLSPSTYWMELNEAANTCIRR